MPYPDSRGLRHQADDFHFHQPRVVDAVEHVLPHQRLQLVHVSLPALGVADHGVHQVGASHGLPAATQLLTAHAKIAGRFKHESYSGYVGVVSAASWNNLQFDDAGRFATDHGGGSYGANHAHSVWRDPVGDFGLDPLVRRPTTSG